MTGQTTGRPRADGGGVRPRRRPPGRRVLGLLAVVGTVALAAAACTSGESAGTTTTTSTPTGVTPTSPTVPPDERGTDTPLDVAWVTQVGGPGADALSAVAGRNDVVLGVGATAGLPSDPPATANVTRALVVGVDASDGSVRTTDEQGSDGSTIARGVGSASTSGLTLTCGSTNGSLGGPGSGGIDPWCAPIGPDGKTASVVRTGGDEDEQLSAVAVTPDGAEAYAAGTTTSLFPGAQDPTSGFLGGGDALVVRLDQLGGIRWARQFGTPSADSADAVAVTDGGDAIVGGTTAGAIDTGSHGGSDGWIARMDPNGYQRWLTQFGTSADDTVRAVAVGGDPTRGTETFVAAGTTRGAAKGSDAGGDDVLVSAFNASGKQTWTAQLGSSSDDVATGVVVDGATVYVAGTAGGPITGAERISLTPTPAGDGGTGSTSTTTTTTTTTPAATGRDGFLAALDANTGEVRWVAEFGSGEHDDVTGATRTETGLLVLSGSTSGQLTDTPPAGGTDGFLVAFRLPASGGGAASVVSARSPRPRAVPAVLAGVSGRRGRR